MKVSIWKVVLGLVLIALLIGGGYAVYQMGYARGVMSDISFADLPFADGDFDGMMPFSRMHSDYRYIGHSSGYTGVFTIGRMLFGGLVFFLIVGGIFRLFGMRRRYMPPWAMHRMHYEGKGNPWMHCCDYPFWGEDIEDDSGDDEGEKPED